MDGINAVDSVRLSRVECWAISDGAAGHQSQVYGLASAVADNFEQFESRLRFPWKFVPTGFIPLRPSSFRSTHSLTQPPWPQLVISCGRQASLTALAVKQQARDRISAVCLQDPLGNRDQYDLIVAPEHDNLSGQNVLTTLGAMHPLTLTALQTAAGQGPVAGLEKLTEKFVAVLLGGPNKYYALDAADVERLAEHLMMITKSGIQLAILPSRRTPEPALQTLLTRFGEEHVVWDRQGENPYLSALALCHYVVVTSDSVSMISEATATGQPVYIEMLQEQRPTKKFRQFQQSMFDRGFARPFVGELDEWLYEPPDESARIAKLLRERFLT